VKPYFPFLRQRPTNKWFNLSKEFGVIVFSQVISVIGSFLSVRVLTEFLPVDEFGSLSLAIFTTLFSVQLFSGPFTNAFTRFYSVAVDENNLPVFYKNLNSLILFLSIANFVIGIVIISLVNIVYGKVNPLLLLLALLTTIISGACAIINGVQTAARNRKNVGFHQTIIIWGKLGFALSFIYILGNNAIAVMTGYSVATLLVFLSELFFLRKMPQYSRKISLKLNDGFANQIIKFSWPFIIWGIFTWIFSASDRWALELFQSRSEVGLYSAVYQVGYLPMTILAGIFSQFISPIIFQRAGNAQDAGRNEGAFSITKWTTISSLLFTFIAFGLAFFIKVPLFKIVVAEDFRQAAYLFPYFILAGGLFETGQFAALRFFTSNTPSRLITPKIITSVGGVGLILYGSKHYGIEGVIGALIIFSIVYLIWIIGLK